jgi:hypothetical protein
MTLANMPSLIQLVQGTEQVGFSADRLDYVSEMDPFVEDRATIDENHACRAKEWSYVLRNN